MSRNVKLQEEAPAIDIETCPRSCDCCGSNEVEEIWAYHYMSRTRHHRFKWYVRNVVCSHCGFAFVSPAPTARALEDYYQDCFQIYQGQVQHYAVEKRMNLIRRYAGAGGDTFVEIGSNYCPDFTQALESVFQKIITVELNESCEKTVSDWRQLPDSQADVVASYFVLEHVPDTRGFLTNCARLARQGAVVILEVPSLHLYPKDPAGLRLYEHVNHFTPATLASIAGPCGLRLEEISYTDCSRDFGFVAIFRKAPATDTVRLTGSVERLQAIACLKAGVDIIRGFEARVQAIRGFLRRWSQEGGKGVVWAANDLCLRLMQDFAPPPGILVVDHDPRKANFLEPIPVHHPDQVLAHMRESGAFVICSRLHFPSIRDWMTAEAGINVEQAEVRILDWCD